MRPRNLDRLASASYDLLIVGGGIHGLACAYEAASRGLHTALVEAEDVGSGASFNHQKTLHGGLRALQSLSLRRAREAVHERRALARIAPWFLRPLPFIVGTYRSPTRSRLALRAAFALDGWIARGRNEGLEPELHLPRARLLSRTATVKLFPGVRRDHLTGGAQWYDYQMVENDRLTFAFAAAADRHGADLATYAEARAALRRNGRIEGLRVYDHLTGADVEVRAGFIVNAAGAGAPDVMRLLELRRSWPLILAMNLVTSKPSAEIAAAAPDPHGRMLTRVPWRGGTIIGTAQSDQPVPPDRRTLDPQAVARFISDANAAFPDLAVTSQDVTLVHRGLVPAVVQRAGTACLLPASRIVDHARDGLPNALSIAGAKYTTARATAERVVTLAGRRLGRSLRRSRTAVDVLPGAGIADHEGLALETAARHGMDLEDGVIRHLTGRYADAAPEIIGIMAARAGLSAPVAAGIATVGAEVVHAIRHEAAMRLADIVLRRTTLGAVGHPGADAVATCASIAAGELGWDVARMQQEIAAVNHVYERIES